MGRLRHPNKHIEKAIQYAEQQGWRVEISNGHDWGRLFLPSWSSRGMHCRRPFPRPEMLKITRAIFKVKLTFVHTEPAIKKTKP